MTESTGDLDHHAEVGVEEVDPCDVATVAADAALCLRARQSGSAHERQEAPFQHGLTTAVEQQGIEEAYTVTASGRAVQ